MKEDGSNQNGLMRIRNWLPPSVARGDRNIAKLIVYYNSVGASFGILLDNDLKYLAARNII